MIDQQRAKIFVRLWQERRLKCEIDYVPLRPLVDQVARDFNCTPLAAYKMAQELRALGVRLSVKEDEARFSPKPRPDFNWRRFGELLIRTKSPRIVCNAFDLDDDQFIRLVGIMTESGVRLPPEIDNPKNWKDLPEWVAQRMRLSLNPHRFSPQEKRTIRSNYNRFKHMPPLSRPKGKKKGYISGGSVYNPRGQYKRRKPQQFRRLSAGEISFLSSYSF